MARKFNISSSAVRSFGFDGAHSIRIREVNGAVQILPTSRTARVAASCKEDLRPLTESGASMRSRIDSALLEVGGRYELVKKAYGWMELVRNDDAVENFVSVSK